MSLLTELKRRNVFKVSLTYLVVAWLTVQVSDTIQPLMSLPEWTSSFVLFAMLIGFPIAVLFAWAFEMTADGVKRTKEVAEDTSITKKTGRKIDFILIGALVLIIGGMSVERLFFAGNVDGVEVAGQKKERISIAVLPFADMSPNKTEEYFTDGISEELLNVLARVPNLHVAARTSSFAFKGKNEDIREIGKMLDVDHILEGSIRKSGTKLRITAQLIKVDSGYHMWSETYDRELTDVFAVQDEISAAILDAMKIHLLGEAGSQTVTATTSTLAYEQYLTGRSLIIKRSRLDIEAAVDYLKNSILQDPNYAPAQAWLGLAYILLENSNSTYGDLSNAEMLALATPPVERALEIDPNNGEAHAIYGLLLTNMSEDINPRALAEYDKAISLNANLAMAYTWRAQYLAGTGKAEEAFQSQSAAYALDPLSILSGGNMVGDLMARGRASEALAILDTLDKVHPRASRLPELRATIAYSRGDYETFVKQMFKALKYEPSDLRVQSTMSNLYRRVGLYDRALKFADLADKIQIFNGQGKHQQAYELGEDMLLKNPGVEWVLSWTAWLAFDAGKTDRALQLMNAAEALLKRNGGTDCENSMIHAWTHLDMPERGEPWVPVCRDEFVIEQKNIADGYEQPGFGDVQTAARMGNFDLAFAWLDDIYQQNTATIVTADTHTKENAAFYADPRWSVFQTKMNARAAEVRALYLLLEKRGEIPNPLGN